MAFLTISCVIPIVLFWSICVISLYAIFHFLSFFQVFLPHFMAFLIISFMKFIVLSTFQVNLYHFALHHFHLLPSMGVIVLNSSQAILHCSTLCHFHFLAISGPSFGISYHV